MNKYLTFFLLVFFVRLTPHVDAQPLYGYQTIGTHTVYLSMSWQQKNMIGFGYNFRISNKTFTDVGIEWRFPFDEMYTLKEHKLITGIYKPLQLMRGFTAIGVHAKIDKRTAAQKAITQYGLAVSVLPSYAYAASLTDGLYGTAGMRISYQAVVLGQIKEEDGTQSLLAFKAHKLELGGHLDMHFERTFGISSNGYFTRTWSNNEILAGADREKWAPEGDVYIGTTYFLKRW